MLEKSQHHPFMALCHLSPPSCSLQNLCSMVSFPKTGPTHLKLKVHQNPARRSLVLACSAGKSSKKGKGLRSTKSNEELCKELREFISTMGFPEDHVPSMKELSENGRKDLANIVRRRGYKLITELLKNSSEKDTSKDSGQNLKRTLVRTHGNQGINNACRDEDSDQERNLTKSSECVSSSSDSSLLENYMVGTNGSIAADTIQACEPSEFSMGSLHAKAANFIHTGVLDTVEDVSEVKNMDMPTDFERDSDILDANGADSASVASRLALPGWMEHQPDRDYAASGEEPNSADFDVALASEKAGESDNSIEIDCLKSMLHQKEMELSLLKQQFEKDKQVLSVLQAKANAEIGNSRSIISAKDVELRAAEESLSGLKEVQIEYWANGETVEVAGSFNGWHHRIKMDLHPSSNTGDPPGSRKSKLWSTLLWLYPGTYEIKFIVDGHWRIDSRREIINSGNIMNNVLRVDR